MFEDNAAPLAVAGFGVSDDGEQAASALQDVHNTISTDQTDATNSTVWMPEQSIGDAAGPGEAPGMFRIGAPPLPPASKPEEVQKVEPETAVNDGILPDGVQLDTSAGAAAIESEIRQRLRGLPGLDTSSDGPNQQLIEHLIKSVARLSIENELLREKVSKSGEETRAQEAKSTDASTDIPTQDTSPPTMPIFKEVHMVYCRDSNRNCFHDEPRIFKGDLMSDHLRGLQGIENITTHLDRHPNIAFAVLNAYNCFCKGGPDYQRLVGYKNGRVLNDSPTAKPITKYVLFNKSLGNALHRITQEHKDSFPGLKGKPRWHCEEPFMLYYVYNKAFLKLCHSAGLDDFDRESVIMVCNWFEENKRKVWDETDELLARGKITFDHYARLFRPGELVIYSEADSFGTVVASRVKPHTWDYDTGLVLVEHWTFSGNFQREIGKVSLATMLRRGGEAITQLDGEVDITDLEVYPLRFAKPELRDQLIARGNRFWRSRKKCLVSYEDPEIESKEVEKPIERRMMIDYNMFRRMHPSNFIFMRYHDDLGSEAMNKEEPPSDEFLATLPPRIHAFDFGSKSWRLIRVDRITDVTWNKEAFKRLVVPEVTKELIQAAVMAHGYHLSPSPDIIAEKGQGLLILLHGGPGTGKTLTAESIAETQERPLYRITCGDVGIEPTTVEKYLNSVLAIGKAWGCVVLLDEADVFLEERTVTDQKQNAIVSVFLRALEYYDGILILTTNRVGTFDEAFKSRIHLAIRYTQLDEDQRVEIWRNFIRMLSKTKERVDTNDLERNIPKLAQVELNGRQIRNVITLARYLARFRKQMLVYQHVQDAFASVVKFDEYLLELRGSDDRWANESKLR